MIHNHNHNSKSNSHPDIIQNILCKCFYFISIFYILHFLECFTQMTNFCWNIIQRMSNIYRTFWMVDYNWIFLFRWIFFQCLFIKCSLAFFDTQPYSYRKNRDINICSSNQSKHIGSASFSLVSDLRPQF